MFGFPSRHDAQIPSQARAVLAALRFSAPRRALFLEFGEDGWNRALAFCGRTHLTLPLALRCRDEMPERARERMDRNLAGNAERWRRIKAVYEEAASAFQAEGLEFVVLKGFTHCPNFVSDPRHRPQYDIDLLFREEQVFRARDVAARLGYEPLRELDGFPADHVPTMIRKTGWEWRGDYFDPEIPLSLELHFRLWDQRTERFGPEGLDQFWERRQVHSLEGMNFPALHPADAAAYAALHLLRHLLRGDPRPYHLYELAWFLDRHADDPALWGDWRELHDDSLRGLQAICFSLAEHWFHCRMPDAVVDEIRRLRPDTARWLETHSESPLAGLFHPNKDELWLHWSLLDSRRDRLAVLRRRLLPERLPGPVDAVHVPGRQLTWRIRWRSRWRWAVYAARRVTHHAGALLPTAWSAMRWFGVMANGPKRDPASSR